MAPVENARAEKDREAEFPRERHEVFGPQGTSLTRRGGLSVGRFRARLSFNRNGLRSRFNVSCVGL
jgi:hypothetical protein